MYSVRGKRGVKKKKQGFLNQELKIDEIKMFQDQKKYFRKMIKKKEPNK